MKTILFLLINLYSFYSFADCIAKPTELSITSLTYAEPTIYPNGSLHLDTGKYPAQIVDEFLQNHQPFHHLESRLIAHEDKDTRNLLSRLIFPRNLKPTTYTLIITPSISVRDIVQGQKDLKVYINLKHGNRLIKGSFYISSDLSPNCRPN